MRVEIPVIIEKIGRTREVQALFYPDIKNTEKKLDVALFKTKTDLENAFKNQEILFLHYQLRCPLISTQTVFIQQYILNKIFTFYLPLFYWTTNNVSFVYTPFLENFLYFFSEPVSEKQLEISINRWIKNYLQDNKQESLLTLLSPFEKKHNFWCNTVSIIIDDSLHKVRYKNISHDDLYYFGKKELAQVGNEVRYIPQDQLEQSIPVLQKLQDQLVELYSRPQRKAILLVGPEYSGRSRLIDCVFKQLDYQSNYTFVNNILLSINSIGNTSWHIASGQLLSGMSVSGAWEKRINSIFYYAEQSNSILCFDQLTGFLEAGKTNYGNLSMSDFLLKALKNNSFRVFAKATQEQLYLLREKNRSLADNFEIVEMPILSMEDNRRVWIQKVMELEEEYSCQFNYDVIPLLEQMCCCYESGRTITGSLCQYLENIAQKWSGTKITSECVINYFREKTGLSLVFFTQEKKNNHRAICNDLATNLTGQKVALDAMADCCLKAESLLNDMSRPISSLFFMGPTGVGKTEAAKQMARYLYGSEEKLLRYDCNELSSPEAVELLTGSGARSGLLTSAVRLHPFSVLLFDEIEKADISLYDLLLQVLGEGRLTDAQGYTVSFAQCIIIFTSNLGAHKTRHTTGFGSSTRQDNITYLRELRQIFRPEWINRIDSIIPFHQLSAEELKIIAQKALHQLQKREGLQRHHYQLYFSREAFHYLVNTGHDPRWGARATFRMIEKKLIAPISELLSATALSTEMVLEINYENKSLSVKEHSLTPKLPQKDHPTLRKYHELVECGKYNEKLIRIIQHLAFELNVSLLSLIKNEYADKEQLNLMAKSTLCHIAELERLSKEALKSNTPDGFIRKSCFDVIVHDKGIYYESTLHCCHDRFVYQRSSRPLLDQYMREDYQWEEELYSNNLNTKDISQYLHNSARYDILKYAVIYSLLIRQVPKENEALLLFFDTSYDEEIEHSWESSSMDLQYYLERNDVLNDRRYLNKNEDLLKDPALKTCPSKNTILNWPICFDNYFFGAISWYWFTESFWGFHKGANGQVIRYIRIKGYGAYEMAKAYEGSNYYRQSNNGQEGYSCMVVCPFHSSEETVEQVIDRWKQTQDGKWKEIRTISMKNEFNVIINLLNEYIDLPPFLESEIDMLYSLYQKECSNEQEKNKK